MEQWQIEALAELLSGGDGEPRTPADGEAVQINLDRLYLCSPWYGQSRYHMVSRDGGTLIIEQCDQNEKYQQRVVLEEPEIAPLLRQLLVWHFEVVQELRERRQAAQQVLSGDDTLPD
jgi:hypothetical protein